MNLVEDLFEKARINRWCTRHCTTCGALDFRKEVGIIQDGDIVQFVEDLKNCDFDKCSTIVDWSEAISLLFHHPILLLRSQEIFDYWLERSDLSPNHCDHLYFYLIRHFRGISPKPWIDRLIGLAEDNWHPSIVESLLIGLRNGAVDYPNLLILVNTTYKDSPRITKLFLNGTLSKKLLGFKG
ncbi:hypothetical protein [Robertkochia sediminum]|uniref:hypothetical protein n=1 Tax=Robertkochia sediminum TaxID=2785326 RepID=UPI001931D62B|nr:hypothetical protein [Robertkochia sediminum]MBL7473100.1 hypothetical protein [Robertkochia sediminum]